MPAVNGVSAQIALMLQVPGFDELDLRSVSRIVTGGGPSTPDLVTEATRRFGAPYTARYSMTESGGLGTETALDADLEERCFTVGRPRGGITVRIHPPGRDPDDTSAVADVDEVGEIHLRGPSVMSGYWRDPDASAAALVDGWLRTGDLGRIDAAGRLCLAGRSKEMYIRGGYNVYPQEVEAALNAHPGVRAVVVVPRPDPVMGEVGVAVVVPEAAGRGPTLDELRAFGEARLARYKLPEGLHVVEAFPVTAMLKVDRRALQADVASTPPTS